MNTAEEIMISPLKDELIGDIKKQMIFKVFGKVDICKNLVLLLWRWEFIWIYFFSLVSM